MIVGLFGLSGNGRDWVHWVQKTDEIYGFWGVPCPKNVCHITKLHNDSVEFALQKPQLFKTTVSCKIWWLSS